MEMARCMVESQALPHVFWLEAVMCAAYVLNRCPTKALKSITHMSLGMVASHLWLICVYLVAWLMLLCQSNITRNQMTRQSHVFLLVTLYKVKVIVCSIHNLNVSWSIEMLFLLRM